MSVHVPSPPRVLLVGVTVAAAAAGLAVTGVAWLADRWASALGVTPPCPPWPDRDDSEQWDVRRRCDHHGRWEEEA